MLMAAGIDDIAIYIPQLYVEASDFAKARGLDPGKIRAWFRDWANGDC